MLYVETAFPVNAHGYSRPHWRYRLAKGDASYDLEIKGTGSPAIFFYSGDRIIDSCLSQRGAIEILDSLFLEGVLEIRRNKE